MRRRAAALAFALFAAPAAAADLAVLSAGAMRSALGGLAANWSHETGHRVSVAYAPAGEIRERLAAGERPDLVILPEENFAELERQGLVEARSRRDLAAVVLAGTLPESLQKRTIYSGAALRGSAAGGVAAMLLDHLAGPEARGAFSARGFSAP